MTWIQQETVEMPQLQSTDEVEEVPEPLEEAVSEALGDGEEQQIHVNIEMYDEVQRQLMRRGCRLQAVVDTIGREGTQYKAR